MVFTSAAEPAKQTKDKFTLPVHMFTNETVET
jgi:hypothetical protein